MIPKKR